MKYVILLILVLLVGCQTEQLPEKILQYNFETHVIDNKLYCQGMDLFKTVQCLNRIVTDGFKYKITNDDLKLSFQELKSNGGDCKNWAEFYIEQSERNGFETEYNQHNVKEGIGHAYAKVYDKTGYCIIDQKYYWCIGYE